MFRGGGQMLSNGSGGKDPSPQKIIDLAALERQSHKGVWNNFVSAQEPSNDMQSQSIQNLIETKQGTGATMAGFLPTAFQPPEYSEMLHYSNERNSCIQKEALLGAYETGQTVSYPDKMAQQIHANQVVVPSQADFSLLQGGGSSNSSSIVGTGNGPTRPTHRRKKSQQPTLMTTKQKQNTPNNATTVYPTTLNSQANRVDNGSFLHQQDAATSAANALKFEIEGDSNQTVPQQIHEAAYCTAIRQDFHHQHAPSSISIPYTCEDVSTQGGSPGKRSTNSNLKDRQSHLHQHQQQLQPNATESRFTGISEMSQGGVAEIRSRTSQAPSEAVRASQGQTLSPKPQSIALTAATLSQQMRERVHSIGYVDLSGITETTIRQSAPLNGQSSAEKKGKNKKHGVTSTGAHPPAYSQYQPSSSIHHRGEKSQVAIQIQNQNLAHQSVSQSHQQVVQPLHKRNQTTKSYYPVGSGLLVQPSSSGGQKNLKMASGSGSIDSNSRQNKRNDYAGGPTSKSSGSHQNDVIAGYRYPEALSHVPSSTVAANQNSNKPKPLRISGGGSGSQGPPKKVEIVPQEEMKSQDMIKQLMKKHFVITNVTKVSSQKEDAKAAYLRHAGAVVQQQMPNSNFCDQNDLNTAAHSSQQTSLQTPFHKVRLDNSQSPQKPDSVTSKGASKRVTFVAPSSNPTSEECSIINNGENHSMALSKISDARKNGKHRRSQYYIDPSSGVVNYGSSAYEEPEYLESEDHIAYGQEEYDSGNQESSIQQEEAPTVVIDSSIDDVCAADYRKTNDDTSGLGFGGEPSQLYGSGLIGASSASGGIRESSNAPSASFQFLDNIQAALLSIRKQEDEEKSTLTGIESMGSGDKKKKAVTIMSVEEEEALINQINEIRDRIRRGETIAQKQQRIEEEREETEEEESIPTQQQQIDEEETKQAAQSEYGRPTHNYPSYSGQQIKPPLYSLTFAQPDLDMPHSQLNEYGATKPPEIKPVVHIRQRSLNSIDNNALLNCLIVTDEPNIYEKKRQRFEKIQRMRGGAQTLSGNFSAEPYGSQVPIDKESSISSHFKHSRDSHSPDGQKSYISQLKNHQEANPSHRQQPSKITVTKQKKSTSQSKVAKPSSGTSGKINSKHLPASSIRRVTSGGKSRQNSTAEQLASNITSHSYQFQKVAKQYELYAPQQSSHKKSALTHSAAARQAHMTLDPPTSHLENGGSASYAQLPEYMVGPHTQRGRPSGFGYEGNDSDEEEMQIQLFSLKKVVPGQPNGTIGLVPQTCEKIKVHRHSSTNAPGCSEIVKKKLNTKQRKGAISIHHIPSGSTISKAQIIQPKQIGSSSTHTKNSKSNLVINVTDAPSHLRQEHLASSVSLKRLKTPKIKAKEDLHTPPTATLQQCIGDRNNQIYGQKLAQFQSVPTIKNLSKSSNKQPVGALNYQNNQATSYKSPFVYPQTSKNSQNPLSIKQQPTSDMKIIDTKQRGASNSAHHIKQKSLHISQIQPKSLQNVRSGSLGGGTANPLIMQQQQPQFMTLEPAVVSKLMSTKRQTDKAFEVMKRQMSDNSAGAPQNIQPVKNISTVTSGATSAQQLPTHQSISSGSTQFYMLSHGGQQSTFGQEQPDSMRPSVRTHFGGASAHSNLQQLSQSNSQSIMEFEKNYKKLSGLIDKIFQ